MSRNCANYDDFVDNVRDCGLMETPDKVSWTDSGLNINEINAACFAEDAEDVVEVEG